METIMLNSKLQLSKQLHIAKTNIVEIKDPGKNPWPKGQQMLLSGVHTFEVLTDLG